MLVRDNVGKVLICGDWHADPYNVGVVEAAFAETSRTGCTLIIHTGDFGYFPQTKHGQAFLAKVERLAREYGIEIWWVDGNHEDHSSLKALPLEADGSRLISPHVKHLPRGLRFNLDGVHFGALGGAFSIDWRSRTPGYSWWPEEVTTVEDLDRLGTTSLDVLVTHDVPAGVRLEGLPVDPLDAQRSYEVRRLIAQAVEQTHPKFVFHGHWHIRHSTELAYPDRSQEELTWLSTQVEGLAHDGTGPYNYGVLDLASLTFSGALPKE